MNSPRRKAPPKAGGAKRALPLLAFLCLLWLVPWTEVRISVLSALLSGLGARPILSDSDRKIVQGYEQEDYEKAAAYIGKIASAAAARGETGRADSLWMEAAILATRHYDAPLSLSCARKALEYDPKDKAALDMIRKLEKIEAARRQAATP